MTKSRWYLFSVVLSILVGLCTSPVLCQQSNDILPHADAQQFTELEKIEPYSPYLERRRVHQTRQIGSGPVGPRELPETPDGVQLVVYESAGKMLQGWLILPKDKTGSPKPGLVYLHNDFSLTKLSYNNALPFAEAGFPVFLPALRGENGNPGDFELLFGEVDDARAAIRWFADQDYVDEHSVYVMGHSIGGGISALLSLYPDLPVRLTADVGGIYRARTFTWWSQHHSTKELIRFNPADKDEISLRLLGPNIREMTRPHISYVGRDDELDRRYAEDLKVLAAHFGAPYEVKVVAGGHMSSTREAVKDFLQIMQREVASHRLKTR